MIRYLLAYIFLFIGIHLTVGQATFYAHVDDEKVYQGSFFKIEYQLSDAKGRSFEAPNFKDFKVAAGPTRSFQTTVVNGRTNSFEGYSYTLKALKEGDYVIQPAAITVGNKRIKSNPVHISVLSPLKQEDLLSKGAPSGEQYFIVAELNKDTAYSGQQILLDYRIFSKINVENVEFRSMPDLSDFYWQGLHLINESVDKVEISGEVYSTKLLKRFTIFPKRVGEHDLDPAQIMLMIPKSKRRGFFFNNYENKYAQSNGLKLVVRELPDNVPKNFSGLVGSYTMQALSPSNQLTTDDALTVRMRIKGNGDSNRFSIKPISTSSKLEAYEPKIISRNNDQNQKKKDHFAVIEYLYTTSEPGKYKVQPEFVYFDVDSNAYVTLKSKELTFNVKQGSGTRKENKEKPVFEYVRADGQNFGQRSLMVQVPTLRWMWLLLLLSGMTFTFFKWSFIRSSRKEIVLSLEEHAIQELTNLQTTSSDSFAHRIEEILGDYYRRKYQITESNWSMNTLQDTLKIAGVHDEAIQRAIDLFNRCKFAAYAGVQQAQRLDWITEAIALVERK